MRLWYSIKSRSRDVLRRTLMYLLDVPLQSDLDENDQKHIKEWLVTSHQNKGFHKYVAARDRAFVQTMIGLDIENPIQRRAYYELNGRRTELVRMKNRAAKIAQDIDTERRKAARRATTADKQ